MVVAKNSCDGGLMAETTIWLNLVPNPSETKTNLPELLLRKIAISLPSQPFLGRHFGFHIFHGKGRALRL